MSFSFHFVKDNTQLQLHGWRISFETGRESLASFHLFATEAQLDRVAGLRKGRQLLQDGFLQQPLLSCSITRIIVEISIAILREASSRQIG